MVCDSFFTPPPAFRSLNKGRVRKSRAKVRRRRVKEGSVVRWVRRARERGLTGREIVYDLHVRREMSLPKVARVLKVSLREVRDYWRQHCAELESAGRDMDEELTILSPGLAARLRADRAVLRAQISLALWETVVATFGDSEVEDENEREAGEDGAAAAPVTGARRQNARARLMAVRIRALKQMGKLYGVGGKRRGSAKKDAVAKRCATPEEIAELVRAREAVGKPGVLGAGLRPKVL